MFVWSITDVVVGLMLLSMVLKTIAKAIDDEKNKEAKR